MAEALTVKYRPARLADLFGQTEAVRSLSLFLKEPYSVAFLFHGDTGVGKTACGYALAGELGCDVENGEWGGLLEIPSGEMQADDVRRVLRDIRLRPMMGSGWRVLIANEADYMSKSAEAIWLDGLEHLPRSCVVVFTTNAPERLTQRLKDRCEVIPFTSEVKRLRPALRAFARKIWAEEVGAGECPLIDTLGMPTLSGDTESMHASFRLCLQQLTRLIRETKKGGVQAHTARV